MPQRLRPRLHAAAAQQAVAAACDVLTGRRSRMRVTRGAREIARAAHEPPLPRACQVWRQRNTSSELREATEPISDRSATERRPATDRHASDAREGHRRIVCGADAEVDHAFSMSLRVAHVQLSPGEGCRGRERLDHYSKATIRHLERNTRNCCNTPRSKL